MLNQFSRTELIFGKEAMEKLAGSRVAIFGIGGVGGFTAEALARSGVGTLDIIDDDKVCLTNINRQIFATRKTVGRYKVEAAKERLLDINPDMTVNCWQTFYTPETADQFDFSQYDYVVDAIDTVKGCIALFTGMVSTMQFNKQNMEASAKNGFTNATDAADYLVNHGVPFRDAHGIVGRLGLTCIDKGISLDELPLEEYKAISPVFENDIYEAISMKTCVEKRMTIGAPGPDVMEKVIAENKKYLEEN